MAAGKAAWQMAKAASDALGSRIEKGVVVTKYGHVMGPIANFDCFEAGHPIPDENSFKGTQAALDLVGSLSEKDTVLFLLSGGGSALFEKPLVEPAELQDIIDLEYRQSLIEQGLVKHPSGKQDMIAGGVFDGVDAVLSCHASGEPGCRFDVGSTLKGFVIFKAVYQGLGAHAGAAPFAGKNALHAAVLAQTGVAFLP